MLSFRTVFARSPCRAFAILILWITKARKSEIAKVSRTTFEINRYHPLFRKPSMNQIAFTQRSRRVGVLTAWLALLIGATLAAKTPLLAAQAQLADAFVDSIGVGVHAHYYDTAYNNWTAVRNAIADIGIRNVRSGPYDPSRLNALTAASGVRINVVIDGRTTGSGSLNPALIDGLLARAKQVTGLRFIEGPNEYDLNNGGEAQWRENLRSYQATLYEKVKSDPILGPSGRNVSVIAPSILWWNANQAPLLADAADYGNLHSYPGGQHPANGLESLNLPRISRIVAGKPLIATETGYHNAVHKTTTWDQPGVSEAAMAKYVPRLFMEYFRVGIVNTFQYELVDEWPDPQRDESEKNYGLLRNDFSYKPAAVALRNLIQLLEDPGAHFVPGTLDYAVDGSTSDIRHLLLQKSSGEYFLAIWREVLSYDTTSRLDLVVPDVEVTLGLPRTIGSAAVYLPNDSLDPVATYQSPTRLNLAVSDRLLLVRLSTVPEPAATTLLLIAAALQLIVHRRSRSWGQYRSTSGKANPAAHLLTADDVSKRSLQSALSFSAATISILVRGSLRRVCRPACRRVRRRSPCRGRLDRCLCTCRTQTSVGDLNGK